MPKVSSTPSAAARSSGTSYQNAQALRRNQACHQCRRRKLKCDAKRPCSTCVRSHAYAISHSPPGTVHPPHPECTFDESPELNGTGDSQDLPAKNRFEQLENRISELESLLREKDGSLSRSTPTSSATGSSAGDYNSSLFLGFNDNNITPDGAFHTDITLDMAQFSSGNTLDDLAGIAAIIGESTHLYASNDPMHNSFDGMEVVSPGWPRNLPNLKLLRHLVEAYFTFTPLARRMFHAPTFLATLSLPPTHPKFPLPAVLHAMCAMGSMYTASIAPNASGDTSLIDSLDHTFAEKQIRAAKISLEVALRTTTNLFESLQAHATIALWYWYNARWSEACVAFSVSLRYAVPCGLNLCAPFQSIQTSNMSRSSIIPPAANLIEDEMRRNTFWIAYLTERQFSAINNFATFLDDADVCQMFPVRADQYEQGIPVSPPERQWSHDRGVIATHLEDQVDSFTLQIKAAMLLSRVKFFNSRYKMKRHLGDPAMQPDPAGLPGIPLNDLIPTAPAFVELDELIVKFLNSFPSHLKDPMANGQVDVALLTAISNAHFAVIVLHEGHANIGVVACVSSCKILRASRAILNLLYEAYSTSRNLSTLGVFPMVCWFAACRVLIRFLRSAIDNKSEEHINQLRTEVDFIRSVISEIGENLPYAYHYGRMLTEYLSHTCGKEYAQPVSISDLLLDKNWGGSGTEPEGFGTQGLHCLDASPTEP